MSNIYSSRANPQIFNTNGTEFVGSTSLDRSTVIGATDKPSINGLSPASNNIVSYGISSNLFGYNQAIDPADLGSVFQGYYESNDKFVEIVYQNMGARSKFENSSYAVSQSLKLVEIISVTNVDSAFSTLCAQDGLPIERQDGTNIYTQSGVTTGFKVKISVKYADLPIYFNHPSSPAIKIIEAGTKTGNTKGNYVAIGLPNRNGSQIVSGSSYNNPDSHPRVQTGSYGVGPAVRSGWNPITAKFNTAPVVVKSTISDNANKVNQITITTR